MSLAVTATTAERGIERERERNDRETLVSVTGTVNGVFVSVSHHQQRYRGTCTVAGY